VQVSREHWRKVVLFIESTLVMSIVKCSCFTTVFLLSPPPESPSFQTVLASVVRTGHCSPHCTLWLHEVHRCVPSLLWLVWGLHYLALLHHQGPVLPLSAQHLRVRDVHTVVGTAHLENGKTPELGEETCVTLRAVWTHELGKT
jgi:hypothetical protein